MYQGVIGYNLKIKYTFSPWRLFLSLQIMLGLHCWTKYSVYKHRASLAIFLAYNCNYFLTHQFKLAFWVPKRTVSSRRFFWVPTAYVLVEKKENNFLLRALIWGPVTRCFSPSSIRNQSVHLVAGKVRPGFALRAAKELTLVGGFLLKVIVNVSEHST